MYKRQRLFHQADVAGVQVAHGRHENDAAASLERRAQIGDGGMDLHDDLSGVGVFGAGVAAVLDSGNGTAGGVVDRAGAFHEVADELGLLARRNVCLLYTSRCV